MESMGVWLSQARLAKGASLQEAAAATCIRLKYLEMLEAGNTAAFPGGSVQARGFLSIYARYLDLSSDDAMARYDSELRGRASAVAPGAPPESPVSSYAPPPVAKPVRPAFRPASRRPVGIVGKAGMWAAVLIALGGLVMAGYLFSRGASGRATAQTVATPNTETLIPPPVVQAAAGVQATPVNTPTAVDSTAQRDDVTLGLEATEHVWVRVIQDGQKVFESLMTPGQVEHWSGTDSILVESGNGAGLLVTLNDRLLGPLGGRGQVSRRAWTSSGEINFP